MNVLSLFSGIGGLDLGLQRSGMTIVGQVEIDPWCRQVLAKHWPEVPRHDDVRTCAAWWQALADPQRESVRVRSGSVDAAQGTMQGQAQQRQWVRADASDGSAGSSDASPGTRAAGRPAVDLVCGGFPCQPVSLAGKGLAQADSRWLWPATRDVIRDLGPRWVLLENVPGLLGRGMGDVLGDLAALGYDAEWDCVPACFVGAPHIRDRVWIVAYPDAERGRCGHQGRDDGLGTPGLDTHVPDAQRDELRHEPRRRHGQDRAGAPIAGDDGPSRSVADADRAGFGEQRRSEPVRAELSATQCGSASLADATSQRRSPRVFPRPHLVNDGQEPAHRHARTWGDIERWPAEPGVGRVAHGIPRRVDRLRGLGNAVVPQVAEHIGRLIMQAAA